jgi:hypothetical protein
MLSPILESVLVIEFHATESYSRSNLAEAKYSIRELSVVEKDHGYCKLTLAISL